MFNDFNTMSDGIHIATIFICKNKIVKCQDGREFEKLIIGLQISGIGKAYKEYPDGYAWAWDAWCDDLKRIDPNIDPKKAASDENERMRVIGMDVEIKIETKKDKTGKNRQRIYIQKAIGMSEDKSPSDDPELDDIDLDEPF